MNTLKQKKRKKKKKKNLASLIILYKWSKYFIHDDTQHFIQRDICVLLADNYRLSYQEALY